MQHSRQLWNSGGATSPSPGGSATNSEVGSKLSRRCCQHGSAVALYPDCRMLVAFSYIFLVFMRLLIVASKKTIMIGVTYVCVTLDEVHICDLLVFHFHFGRLLFRCPSLLQYNEVDCRVDLYLAEWEGWRERQKFSRNLKPAIVTRAWFFIRGG